jgi:hypothetical protein
MNNFVKTGLFLCFFVLVGGGCVNITINGVETEIPLQDIADETSQFVDEVNDTNVYGNIHGYSFSYPSDKTLWSDIDQPNQLLIEATERDLVVNLAEDEGIKLFQTEVNTLRFQIIETSDSPVDYASVYIDEFIDGEAINNFFGEPNSFMLTSVQGNEALDVYGEGNLGSKYRVLVIDLGDELLIIKQGLPNPIFNDVFASLTIE